MEPQAAERTMSGNIVRGVVEELKSRHLFDSVRAGVSPEAQALMDAPPLPIAWVPSRRYEELVDRLGQIAGREQVKDVTYAVTRNTVRPLILPLIKTFLRLFGATPASVLKNVGKVASIQSRGIQFEYVPEAERSGVIVMRYPDPVSDFVFASWEGSYRFGKDATGEPAFTVGRCQISEGGKVGRMRVQW